MGLTVTLLAYHEAENLKWFLPELKKVVDTLELDSVEYLVIDSARPTDDTEEICRTFNARYVPQEEPGYGGAYRTAIKYASEEIFLILDADASQDHTRIPQMYQAFMEGADVVIGSRYVAGGKTDDAKSSQVMSRILNFAFQIATGVKVHDFSDSFRIYRTQDLRALHLECRNFDISEELILKLKLEKQNDFVYREIPIAFKKRVLGESKRSLFKFIISFGRLMVYCFMLRFLARKEYIPEKHDKRAWEITDLFLYGAVGAVAALINIAIFVLLENRLHYLLANLLAWFITALLASAVNKVVVFNSWGWNRKTAGKELQRLAVPRLLSGILDMLLMWVLVENRLLAGWAAKALVSVVVFVLDQQLNWRLILKKEKAQGVI